MNESIFNSSDYIALAAMLLSLIVTVILLLERSERRRPQFVISYDKVRSNLACVILKNVGQVALEVLSIEFDPNWTKQLDPQVQEKLKVLKDTYLTLLPQQEWVIFFHKLTSEIIGFDNTILNISYGYRRIPNTFMSKTYKENITYDFKSYGQMLLYKSDLDELRTLLDDKLKAINSSLNSISSK